MWNINNLPRASRFSKVVCEAKDRDLDIIGIVESFMRGDEAFPMIEGYCAVVLTRQDDDLRGGGVGFYIKTDIGHDVVSVNHPDMLAISLKTRIGMLFVW